uniref:Uncharacterized protein n=1 Tax=Tetraselmis chuii TaxID=63592 RepID=A0A7S1T026_9CHLO|mmetsp:Transcript_37599/g.67356  ORF Transcript_37599/g.67356 Transcript_37599/m.67356 type:complete len:115 (+) Transcript_37599:73-417(+)
MSDAAPEAIKSSGNRVPSRTYHAPRQNPATPAATNTCRGSNAEGWGTAAATPSQTPDAAKLPLKVETPLLVPTVQLTACWSTRALAASKRIILAAFPRYGSLHTNCHFKSWKLL